MEDRLKQIDYKKVFYYFEQISNVPRGSRNNKGISDYLVSFAKEHNLLYHQDEALNVVIVKEATKGYEDASTVMIQGHMDMVCEKESGHEHDFTTEGLDLHIDGDFVYANKTTLGGDNGIAVAYALAILDSNDLPHPRLEVVITTDEEIGMDGATALDASTLKAKYLLNIDSEDEGTVLCSCAGGLTAQAEIPFKKIKVAGQLLEVTVKGLLGGHSGMEIINNRTNATVLMGRLLQELMKQNDFYVSELQGGLKDNAIPRETKALLVVDKNNAKALVTAIRKLEQDYKNELKTSDPGFYIEIQEKEESEFLVIDQSATTKILMMILMAPNGIQVMSSDIKGLVESSLNLGIFHTTEDKAVFGYSVRSSMSSYKDFMSSKLEFLTELLGGNYSTRGDYPAWEFNKDSKLREKFIEVFDKMYGYEPKVEAIHAGLECGILASKLPGIDIVSFGPNMQDIHTPKERLSISSAIRVFDYVAELLASMKDM